MNQNMLEIAILHFYRDMSCMEIATRFGYFYSEVYRTIAVALGDIQVMEVVAQLIRCREHKGKKYLTSPSDVRLLKKNNK